MGLSFLFGQWGEWGMIVASRARIGAVQNTRPPPPRVRLVQVSNDAKIAFLQEIRNMRSQCRLNLIYKDEYKNNTNFIGR
jgi:hypothetical protein